VSLFSPSTERRLLQIAVAVGGIVPVSAGLGGGLLGSAFVRAEAFGSPLDSHVRYLSGLLLGIGITFWLSIHRVERHGERVRILSAIVVLGGLFRLAGALRYGFPGMGMSLALIMELVVTPLLCLWQYRIAGLFGVSNTR
jgi:hypothetical protein